MSFRCQFPDEWQANLTESEAGEPYITVVPDQMGRMWSMAMDAHVEITALSEAKWRVRRRNPLI